MELSGPQREGLHNALLKAIYSERELERLLWYSMDVRLGTIVAPGSLEDVVFELLNWLESQGRLQQFIKVLRQRRPYHNELRTALDNIENVQTPVPSAISPRGWFSDWASRVVERSSWLLRDVRAATAKVVIVALVVVGLGSATLVYWLAAPGQRNDNTNNGTNENRPNETHSAGGDKPAEVSPATSGIWKDAFVVGNDCCIAYTSPDSIYDEIKKRIDDARESILIGVYDFNSVPVKDMILNAVRRGVKISMLLDYNPGATDEEGNIVKELTAAGVEVIKGPAKAGAGGLQTYHLKVLVIDSKWTMVQSANLTRTGIPVEGAPGNREAGIAVNSKELADFFTKLFQRDKELAARLGDSDGPDRHEPDRLYEPRRPVQRVPAFNTGKASADQSSSNKSQPQAPPEAIRILPVLTPDNYMEVLPQVLAAARESIEIEQQYIRPNGENVRKLLNAIRVARQQNPDLKVRLILSGTFIDPHRFPADLETLKEYGLHPNDNVRFLSTESGMHCSNRMIVIDGKFTLLGSNNWSEAGVTRNRDASLLIDSKILADFYKTIFDIDWDAGIDPTS